jgi:succinate dehydrogenase / fumarate reductase membrane anchor subunit
MSNDLRNPLQRARGLGSAKEGVGHWWTQRLTAMALVLLGIWFVVLVLGLLHADYATARAAIGKPWNALLLIVFLVAMFWHAVLGLQVVIEDYVHTRWQEVVLMVLAVLRIALGS